MQTRPAPPNPPPPLPSLPPSQSSAATIKKGGLSEGLPLNVRWSSQRRKYSAFFSSIRLGGTISLSTALDSPDDAERLVASARQLLEDMADYLKNLSELDAKRVFRCVLAQKESELMQGTYVTGDRTYLPLSCDNTRHLASPVL